MKLYEILDEIEACVTINDTQAVNTTTGEIIDIVALEKLKIDRDTKISNIACWIKNLRAEVEAVKQERKAFMERERVCTNKMEALKEYLAYCLQGKKYSDAKVAISYRKSEAVEVDEDYIPDIPEEYMRYAEPEVSLTAVKEALKAGIEVPGCQLVQRTNIQIR